MPFDKKLVLVAGLEAGELTTLAASLSEQGPPLIFERLRRRDEGRLLGTVLEEIFEAGARPAEEEGWELPYPLIFFALFPRSEIDAFIEVVKRVVPRRTMFAALTPTNIAWTVNFLVEHLIEEHERFLELEARQADDGKEANK